MITADISARPAQIAPSSVDQSPITTTEIGMILALLVIYQLLQMASASYPGAIDLANIIGPVGLIIIMSYGIFSALIRWPSTIWGALFWFRVACATYYGVGNLVALTDDPTTLAFLKDFYYYNETEVYKFNLIVTFSILFVYIGAIFSNHTYAVPKERKSFLNIYYLTLAFLIFGGIARYGIVLPFLLNVPNSILPSIVFVLAKIYSAGLLLLTVLALQRRNVLVVLVIVLIALEMLAGVLIFNKTDVILTCLSVTIAFYIHRPKLSTLVVALTITFLIFVNLLGIVEHGRNTLIFERGSQSASFEDRLAIIENYRGEENVKESDERVSRLTRFSYVNAAALVISRYDAGLPTETLSNVVAVFIPRFLWPDKPDLTYSGRELYTLATGNDGTSVSAGIFAEIYGNFGWWGIPGLSLLYGVILSLISRAMSDAMARRDWALLPVALLGILIGARVDGSFVIDVIGAPFTLAIFTAIIVAATRVPVKGDENA